MNWAQAFIAAMGFTGMVLAGPQEADRGEATFRQYWKDRFTTFTQDQNVAGRGQRPDGAAAIAGKKSRFNNDDGFQYQGYLTYHAFPFNTVENAPSNTAPTNPTGPANPVTRTLYGFISPHGNISAAGGSSLLERTVYEAHEKYMKEEEKARLSGTPLPNDTEGVRHKSIFKVTTEKVFQNSTTSSSPSPSTAPDPKDKVERWELRPEVKAEIEKVGEEAFSSVNAAAKDKGSENDDSALPNSTLLYEAAGRAYDAWWNSTLANLGQARANREIRGGPGGIRAQLSEDVATCEDWAQKTRQKLQEDNPQLSPSDEKQLDQMRSQCQEIVQASYRSIDPSFQNDPNDPSGTERLQAMGADKEDARERDLRVQLEILANPQQSPGDIASNWRYSEKDSKSPVTLGFDENASTPETANITVKEQVQSYNEQLELAAQGYAEVKKRLPGLDVDPKKILQFQIKADRSAKEISALPQTVYEEDSGAKKPGGRNAPTNYSQLLEQRNQ